MNKFIYVALFLGLIAAVHGLPQRREVPGAEQLNNLAGETKELAKEGWGYVLKLIGAGKGKAGEVLHALKSAADKFLSAPGEPEAARKRREVPGAEQLNNLVGETKELAKEGWGYVLKLIGAGKDKAVEVLHALRSAADKVLPPGALEEAPAPAA